MLPTWDVRKSLKVRPDSSQGVTWGIAGCPAVSGWLLPCRQPFPPTFPQLHFSPSEQFFILNPAPESEAATARAGALADGQRSLLLARFGCSGPGQVGVRLSGHRDKPSVPVPGSGCPGTGALLSLRPHAFSAVWGSTARCEAAGP